MTDKQPEALRAKLKTYEDLGDAVSDVQLLRMGYAAARLEIESLKAQLAERASRGQAPAQAAPAAVVGLSGRLSNELRSMIEGMSVSVDVSTDDATAGHRYFGTVTEVMDDVADKHGVTLLVQDAKPNFAAAPTTQQEAQEPVAVVVPCYTPSGKRVALYSAKQDLPIGTQLYTAPQPVEREPLTDELIKDGAERSHIHIRQMRAFVIGARFAERAHGIGETP